MPDANRAEPDEPHNRVWRVGAAAFDQSRRELRVHGELRTVEAKPLLLLETLLMAAGDVVKKEELFATVWKDRTVVEQSLTTAIGKLREVLGDEGRVIIEAVRGVGYRIGLPIEIVAAPEKPRLAFRFQAGEAVPNRQQWRLERPLGGGAALDVWLARHTKTGEYRVFKFADTAERRQALRREAALSRILHQALGDRPDLVRISEWSFESRPAFVESPFGGSSLPEWSASRGGLTAVPLMERLAIVARIARTVAAAHDVGVLHRDIKPSNVLVSGEGSNLAVRLVDFGSGRLTEAARIEAVTMTGLSLTSAATQDGERLSGTLRYMAPEVIMGGPPTIAADVYALGVLLYQMIVCDLDRSLTVGCEAEIADVLLRADVLQAAARSQEKRLSSAALLADRLESIENRRDEAARIERLKKEARGLALKLDRARLRRPWLILAVASLVLGLFGTTLSALQTSRARDKAERQSAIVGATNRFLTDDIIAAADPNLNGRSDLTVAAALRRAAARIDGTRGNNPEIRAALHAAMETAFTNLSDYDRALSEGEHALAAVRMEDRPDWATIADIQLRIINPLAHLGHLREASVRLVAAEDAIAHVHPARPELSVRVWDKKGFLARQSLDLTDYLHDAQNAWKLAEHVEGMPSQLREELLMSVGEAYQMIGKSSEAEIILRRLLQIEDAEYGPDDARPSYVAAVLGNTIMYQGRTEEAMSLVNKARLNLEHTLGPSAGLTIDAIDLQAGIYFKESRFEPAAKLWSEVVAQYEQAGDPAAPGHVNAQTNLARAWMRAGNSEAAERMYRVLLNEQRGKFDPNSPRAQYVRFYLAYVLLQLGRPEEVPELRRNLTPEALTMAQQESDWPGRILFIDGRLALEQGNRSVARALLTKAQDLLKPEIPDGLITPAVLAPLLKASLDDVHH